MADRTNFTPAEWRKLLRAPSWPDMLSQQPIRVACGVS